MVADYIVQLKFTRQNKVSIVSISLYLTDIVILPHYKYDYEEVVNSISGTPVRILWLKLYPDILYLYLLLDIL